MTTRKTTKRRSAANRFLEDLVGPLTFANMIESTRLSEGLTLVQFSKRLGISVSHLSDIEKGRKAVSPERAAKFARLLGYSEKQFVRLALQDLVRESGLRFRVSLRAA